MPIRSSFSPSTAYLLVSLQRVRTLMPFGMYSMSNGTTLPGSGPGHWPRTTEETIDRAALELIQQGNHVGVAANTSGSRAELSEHGNCHTSSSLYFMEMSGANEDSDFQSIWESFIELPSPTESRPNEHAMNPSSIQRAADAANDSVVENQEPIPYSHISHASTNPIYLNSGPTGIVPGSLDPREIESRMIAIGSRGLDGNGLTQHTRHNVLYPASIAESNTTYSQAGALRRSHVRYEPYLQTLSPSQSLPTPQIQAGSIPNSHSMYHAQFSSGFNPSLPNGNSLVQCGRAHNMPVSTDVGDWMPKARKTAESQRKLGANDTQRKDPTHQERSFACDEPVCAEYKCDRRPCNEHICGKKFAKEWNLKRHIEEHQSRRGEVSEKLSCPVRGCPKQNHWTHKRIGNLRDHLAKNHKLSDKCPQCHLKFERDLLEHLMLPGTQCGVRLKWKEKANVEGYNKDLPRTSPPPSAFTNTVLPLDPGGILEVEAHPNDDSAVHWHL